MDTLTELATTLSFRIKKQRDKWIEVFYQTLHNFNKIRESHQLNFESALPVVSAFQIVHVMSFIHANKYLKEEQIGEFSNIFTETLCEGLPENLMEYVQQYQANKEKDFAEQLCYFCEDVAMAIFGSYSGMMFGPGFTSMAMEFLYRNWGIVADHFGDTLTMEECARAVTKIRERTTSDT